MLSQKISLSLIIIPGVILGIVAIIFKKHIGLWLISYGMIVGGTGIFFSIIFKEDILDVLILIDATGVARAYVIGCMLMLAGCIVKIWELFQPN